MYFDVEVNIHSTENIKFVNVLMVSKSVLVKTEKIKMKNRVGSFTFNAKFEFAPITSIIAYYVNNDNEIVSDSATVSLRDRLPNFVSKNVTNKNIS